MSNVPILSLVVWAPFFTALVLLGQQLVPFQLAPL